MTTDERLRRWRLALGTDADAASTTRLAGRDAAMDRALSALYGHPAGDRSAGLGGSAPQVARWLGDIRE